MKLTQSSFAELIPWVTVIIVSIISYFDSKDNLIKPLPIICESNRISIKVRVSCYLGRIAIPHELKEQVVERLRGWKDGAGQWSPLVPLSHLLIRASATTSRSLLQNAKFALKECNLKTEAHRRLGRSRTLLFQVQLAVNQMNGLRCDIPIKLLKQSPKQNISEQGL